MRQEEFLDKDLLPPLLKRIYVPLAAFRLSLFSRQPGTAEERMSLRRIMRSTLPGTAAVLAAFFFAGCAHTEEPSFFEQMLSGTPGDEAHGSRAIAPELRLTCSVGGAEVLLDGVLQGYCMDFERNGLPLSDGMHNLEVRMPGYLPYIATLEAGRARMTLNIDLIKIR